MNKFKALLDRLRQPSTIAGLAAFGVLAGVPADTLNHVGQGVIAVAGLLGVFLDENKGG